MSDITGEQGDARKGAARTATPQGHKRAGKQTNRQQAGTEGLCLLCSICHRVPENTVIPLL